MIRTNAVVDGLEREYRVAYSKQVNARLFVSFCILLFNRAIIIYFEHPTIATHIGRD